MRGDPKGGDLMKKERKDCKGTFTLRSYRLSIAISVNDPAIAQRATAMYGAMSSSRNSDGPRPGGRSADSAVKSMSSLAA